MILAVRFMQQRGVAQVATREARSRRAAESRDDNGRNRRVRELVPKFVGEAGLALPV